MGDYATRGEFDSLQRRLGELADDQHDLRGRQDKVEHLTEQLRKDQRQLRNQIRQLEKNVPERVQRALDDQTYDLKVAMAESETRNADRIVGLARQWPAGAIVALTVIATAAAGAVADGILAALHLAHLG